MNLLLKITELVDRDIAANSQPISIIGMMVPFIPFVLFVTGPPADTHPILGGAAIGLSAAWFLFVMWRLLLHVRKQLAPSYRSLGPTRFWWLTACTVLTIFVFAALLMWLKR